MKKLSLAALLLVALVAAVTADTVVEEIIARINNEIITKSDFQEGKQQLLAELKQQNPQEAERLFAEREKDTLRDLVDQQLLIQRGRDLGITADTEVIKRLDEIRKSMNLESMEDLEKAAEQQGVSYEDFKQTVREGIITQIVIGREVGSRLAITPEEVRGFYEENKQKLSQPERVRLAEILVDPVKVAPEAPEAEQLVAAETRARELLAQIKAGAKFDEVAQKSSHGPTASRGGDLGPFKRGDLAESLEQTVFAMKAGDVSDVIRTKQGYIILKVEEHHAEGVPPVQQVEGRIREALYYQKLAPALRQYLTKLREDAYIDIKDGYVDTGASPNQTKPVIVTASAQDQQPKKKKKKFLIF
jgi:peptidyl-prolyl cis-trans isomerase SurA